MSNRKQRRALAKTAGPVAATFAAAVRAHQTGALAEAEAGYHRVLAAEPAHADALHNLGIVHHQKGEHDMAAALIGKAVAIRPDYALAWSHLGLALARKGAAGEAVAAGRRAVALAPQQAAFHYNLGIGLAAAGLWEEAAASHRQAVTLQPAYPEAWSDLGNALKELGRPDEAVDCYRQALALAPGYAEAHSNLGLALLAQGETEAAIEACRRAVAAGPGLALAHYNLGNALRQGGQTAEAIATWRHAVALDPGLVIAHFNLGTTLTGTGAFAEAVASLRRAVDLQPGNAEALLNLGDALKGWGRLDEAVAAFRRALVLRPDYVEAHLNLAAVLGDVQRLEEATACYEEALRLRPGDAFAFRWLLLAAVYRDDLDAAALKELHLRFGAAMAQPCLRPAVDADPERRIRIGYLSGDLRMHPVAFNMLPGFRHHDRTRFAIHVYDVWGGAGDAMTEQFRTRADCWSDVSSLTDDVAAERIRADGIDILVSLAGRFDSNRPQICAYRPAPIQINMHDVATSGLAEMDYTIADRRLVPRDTAEFFTERVLRLPSLVVCDPPPGLPLPGRREGPPVLACFNNPKKIIPPVLALWRRVLEAMPEARLVLKYMDAYRSEDLKARFAEALGPAAARVDFIAEKEPLERLLARYNDVDMALDTFPFSGSTTSFQALACGVPVATLPRDRMVARWTTTMLGTLGLEELVAKDEDDFVRIATGAVSWRDRRADIRNRLATSPLCDGARWARHLERLYRAVWRHHCAAG
jgi:predicted O-linked N-acetylglucosamine transferase (SPINDLY family)